MDSLDFDATGGEGRPPSGFTGLTGQQIGRYLIGQPLGSGGAATVFRAYDQVQGATVALKLLLPGADEKAYDRFRREATLAGALRHPHIVRILQIGIAPKGEVAYIAMELVEGESLSDLLTMRGRLRPEETANLLEPIARALAYAHRQGVVHRDVKPGNILLRTASPGAPNSVQLEALEYPVIPLLSDFGIARALDAPELTVAGRTVGTPAYMAPEQCAGSRDVDGRADIYSLGAVIYRCLTGRLPYSGTTTQILHAQVYEPLVIEDAILRTLPPLLVDVLQRSMAKRPEDRYADADALGDALAAVAGRVLPGASAAPGDGSTATLTLSAIPVTQPPPAAPRATVLVPGLGESLPAAGAGGQQPLYASPANPQAPHGQPSGAGGAPGAVPGSVPPGREPTRTNPLLRSAGSTGGAYATGGSQSPPVEPATLQEIEEPGGLGSRLERLNWPGLAISAVIGLFAILLIALFGIQGPGLLDRLVGGPTPPGEVSQATGTPGLLPGGVITTTVTATPTASATPSAMPSATGTASPVPTATDTATPEPPTATPVPPPTDTPLPAPTATPTWTPLPTATPLATPTPGPNPTLAACLGQIDPGLQTYLLAQDPAMQAVYGCPDGPPLVGIAQSWPFERGYIVGFNMTPDMLVVYTAGQQWERQFVPEGQPLGEPPPGEAPPPEGLYLPTGRFGALWAQGERRNELGYATAAGPGEFPAVYQSFPSALLILNQTSGQVTVLPTASQR